MTEINDDLFFNDRQHQGKFLNWAFHRIQKEINEIEYMESEFGTAEWVKPTRPHQGRPPLGRDKQLAEIAKVDALRDEGYSFKLACELAGVPQGSYSRWRSRMKLEPYKKGVKGTRLGPKPEDAGSTPATSTVS